MKFDDRKHKYLVREELKQQIKEKQGWYFITFVRELPTHRPYGFTLFDEPFVLFKNANDRLVCYSLASIEDREKDKVELQSFKVKEKQGEIWFWRGNISLKDNSIQLSEQSIDFKS